MASHRAAAGDGTSSLLAIITAGHEEGWPHVDATAEQLLELER